jgi:tight adherence protein B
MNDMLLLVVVVFVGVFVVLALLLFATGAGALQRTKQTLANLESVLASHSRDSQDQMVDIRKTELLSAVPWMNRWLLSIALAPKLRALLLQANLNWTAGRLLLMGSICFVIPGYLVYVRTDNVFFGLMMGLLCGFAPFAYVLQKRKKRFELFEQGLPEALDLIVSALRAGHSLVAALRLVAQEAPDPIGSEFRICFEEQNYGLELRTAMENLVERVPLQDLRIVATAILIQKESGGNLAEVLDKAASVIRDRFRLRRQVRVHTAQGRLTGIILSILPVVLGFLLYLVNPETMSLLWKTPAGLKLMYVAITMTIVGGLIIRKIVNMEV